jgi:hypothetical protein
MFIVAACNLDPTLNDLSQCDGGDDDDDDWRFFFFSF